MEPVLVATAAALLYGVIGWFVGDRFPFSRYSMYASLRGREEGAVLVVRADGREVPFYDVVAWHGVDPEALEPFTVPCSLHWVVFEAQRWISGRTTTSGQDLPAAIEVGYRVLRVTPDGLAERWVPRAAGRGRLRA